MYYEMTSFGDLMFTIVPIIVIGTFIFIIVKGISEWTSNNNSPKLTVPAEVVAKRAHTSRHHHHNNDHMHMSSSTSYYVTFQFDSGDRTEFSVKSSEYSMLAENDRGMLTFQGTRYLNFERKN